MEALNATEVICADGPADVRTVAFKYRLAGLDVPEYVNMRLLIVFVDPDVNSPVE